MRKLLAARPWLVVVGLSCLDTTRALANGRVPGATGLAIHPTDERQLLLGLSYGLALTRDGGESWSWICEGHIEGNGGDLDPSIALTGNGTLVVLSLTNGGVLISRDDGCTFERVTGILEGQRGVDLTLDPSQPGRVLALMSTIVGEAERTPRYRNMLAHSLDHGSSWMMLAPLPEDMSPETVELAPSDPGRIYVSGTSSADPLLGIVERSDDGGLSWRRTTVRLPRGSGSLFLSGIHPRDPERLWFRVPGRGDVYGVLPARLLRSTDGAASFDQVADTRSGMLGFALSPDGERVAFGGPFDGLFVAPADGSAAPSKLSELQVKCLRWAARGLYVCAGEPSDPYGLGVALAPPQDFVPLWHRADTCHKACPAPSSIETSCRGAWEAVAPLVGSVTAVCGASPTLADASADTAVDAPATESESEAEALSDAASDVPDARDDPAPRASSGCMALSYRRGGGWWLVFLTILVAWRRRLRPV